LKVTSVLRWRLISGSVMVSLLVGLCWLDAQAARPGIYLAPLVVLLGVLAAGEMLRMFRARGGTPLAWVVYVGTLLPVLASCMPIAWSEYPEDCPVGRLGWLACGLAVGLLVALLGEMLRYGSQDNPPGTALGNLSLATLSILYVGGLLGFLIQLRLFPGIGDFKPGLAPLLSLILVVKVSDTCQYFVGRRFGKKKLAPVLSPGKTWEGAVGGIGLGALLTATILSFSLESNHWALLLVYCLVLSLAGLVGDLAESLLKRDAGVKDSSSWLPGLGGVLDMLDSLLLAGPVAYACWLLGMVGP
jgi:phosphatidate cytidylyltransferase